MIGRSEPTALPCPGYPVDLLFPDVEPDVLRREAASENAWHAGPGAAPWHAYLQRVLPTPEQRRARLPGEGRALGPEGGP